VQTKLYIDGELTDGLAGREIDVINPADGTVLATVAEAGAEDIDRAVAAATQLGPLTSEMRRDRVVGHLKAAVDENAKILTGGTEYGLGGGLWTADLSRAHRVASAMRSGMVWVNCYKRVNPGSPFGGVGRSGYGREMGFAAMAEYTTEKSVWINVDAPIPDWYAQ